MPLHDHAADQIERCERFAALCGAFCIAIKIKASKKVAFRAAKALKCVVPQRSPKYRPVTVSCSVTPSWGRGPRMTQQAIATSRL
jgi:hypothetical protein